MDEEISLRIVVCTEDMCIENVFTLSEESDVQFWTPKDTEMLTNFQDMCSCCFYCGTKKEECSKLQNTTCDECIDEAVDRKLWADVDAYCK